MPKIQVLSDLHLEFEDYTPHQTDADIVVLAGDIHLKVKGVLWAKQHFKQPVVYVPGNHEYYGGSLGHTLAKMQAAAEGSNIHLLHNSSVVLGGVRFVGGTLWTDYRLTGNQPSAMLDAQQVMSDFRKIRDEDYRKVRPAHLAVHHAKTRKFLETTLEQPFDGTTVVVTHHAPSELSISAQYLETGGHLNAAYASNLTPLIGMQVNTWIHGHVHDSFDYDLYGTRVVCNPRGYAPNHLNRDFDPGLLIDL